MSDKESITGNMALKIGLITSSQLDECLAEQDKERQANHAVTPLATLLVSKNFLTPEQLDHILKLQSSVGGPAPASSGSVVVPGYEILEKLGQGGMGVVYKARQSSLHRIVAVKVLTPQLASDGDFIKRFQREALAAAALEHPNIVRIYDVGHGACHYLVMEYVPGKTLKEILEDQKVIPENRAVHYISQAARALDFASRHGIVHRDIKPDNLMVDSEDTVKLMDMGLARRMGERGTQKLTMDGDIVGTPEYMSPEQVDPKADIDTRSDIYSLGATFYHLVTGEPPFDGPNVMAIVYKHVNEKPPWPKIKVPTLSDAVCRIIMKMMEKDRRRRYQTPQELGLELEQLSMREKTVTDLHVVAQEEPKKTTSFQTPVRAEEPASESPVQKIPWPKIGVLGAGLLIVLILHLLGQRELQFIVVGLLAVGVVVYFIRDSAKEKAEARKAATGIHSPLPKASPMVPLNIEIPQGWRSGLVGEYFSRPDFDGLSLRRVDEAIRFTWDGAALLAWMKAGKVSIRWVGGIYAPVNGVYLFTLRGNGGLKMTIGATCVFNELNSIHPTPTTIPVPLNEGTYEFRLEYVHEKGPVSILFGSAAQPMAPDLPPGPPPTLVHDPKGFTPFDATPPDIRKAISIDAKGLQPGLWVERVKGSNVERKAAAPEGGFQWEAEESASPELCTYRWTGYLKIPKFGTYKFNVSQEATLKIDDVVIFAGLLGECALEEGWHKFHFEYAEVLRAARVILSLREGSNSATTIPGSHFFRAA